MTAGASTTTAKATFSPPSSSVTHSLWHSPIPYLYGGLGAMVGLIAVALLLLACSYRRRSGGGEDVEIGATGKGESTFDGAAPPAYEDKVLVIMAGEAAPTFLATPKDLSSNDGKEESDKREDETEAAAA